MRVLVVGAGPTGLTAALTLGRLGIDVEVLEAQAELSGASLAATFHPPTLAILERLGIDLSSQGRVINGIEYRRGTDRVRLDLGELPTHFAYRRHLPQLDLCRLLLAELDALPNVDVTFDSHATPPAAQRFDLVVAADGARSRWRQAAGVNLREEPYTGHVARLICGPLNEFADVTYVFTDHDSVSVLPMSDHTRVILRLGQSDPELPILTRRATEVLGVAPQVRTWSSYGTRRAVVTSNLVGNLLIIGDAAHQTNTRGGMNMNAGIHDAFLLGTAFARGDLPLAAAQRLDVWRDQLLPRTHATLGPDQFEHVRRIADDHGDRLRFLMEASMMDMVP